MSLANVVGVLASMVFLVRLLPQPIRLMRSGVTSGVSPLAAANSVVNAVAWTGYGFAAGLPIVWVVSLLAVIPSVWTATLLRRSFRNGDRIGAMAWLGVVVTAALIGRLGFVLAASVALTMGPQVLMSLRRTDLRGVAPSALWIGLVDASTWGLYGLVLGDSPLVSYALVLAASCITILARIAITRPTWPAEDPIDPEIVPPVPGLALAS